MIEWLTSLPSAIRLGVVLGVTVALMRTRLPLAIGLFAGAAALGLLFPMGVGPFFHAVGAGLTSDKTLFLIAIVVAILVFSGALNSTGQIQRIVKAFQRMFGRSRLTLVAFPALIGLLPMPGGAIFSAPMVRQGVDDPNVSPQRLTIANYWFRHVWEYWFPLYPGVILALTLTELPVWRFILVQLPMTAWVLASGYVVILHGLRLAGRDRGARDISRHSVWAFVCEVAPILLVVAAVLFLTPVSEYAGRRWAPGNLFVSQSAVLVAMLLGLGWLVVCRGLRFAQARRELLTGKMLKMVLLMFGIMVFRDVLESCGAVQGLNAELKEAHIPLFAVVCLLPFITGVVVGIAFGFVGASFPFVLALLEAVPPEQRLPWIALAYCMGYAGMMLSPVHLCLLLTNQFFESNLVKVYFYLLPLGLGAMAAASGLFALYTRFLW